MTDRALEIYRQRYETWRHLDELRWKKIQFIIAIGSGAMIVYRTVPNLADNWLFYTIVGISIFVIAIFLLRNSYAIIANGKVLKSVSDDIGDHYIPDVSRLTKSFTFWLSCVLIFFSVLIFFKLFYNFGRFIEKAFINFCY